MKRIGLIQARPLSICETLSLIPRKLQLGRNASFLRPISPKITLKKGIYKKERKILARRKEREAEKKAMFSLLVFWALTFSNVNQLKIFYKKLYRQLLLDYRDIWNTRYSRQNLKGYGLHFTKWKLTLGVAMSFICFASTGLRRSLNIKIRGFRHTISTLTGLSMSRGSFLFSYQQMRLLRGIPWVRKRTH